jgi:hypothetical protein
VEGPAGDVFGLVASFYHLLTGGRPFIAGRAGSARLVLAQQWRPELIHNRRLVRVLEQGLSTKARERFDTVIEFRRALEVSREEAVEADKQLSGTRKSRSGTEPRIQALKRPSRRSSTTASAKPGVRRSSTGALPIVERRKAGRTETGRRRTGRRRTGEVAKAAPQLSADEVADQIFAALGTKPGRPASPVTPPPAPAPSEAPDDDDMVFGADDDDALFGEEPAAKPAPEPAPAAAPVPPPSPRISSPPLSGVAARLSAFSDALHSALMKEISEHGRFEITDVTVPEDPGPPDSDALFGA